MHFKRTDKMGLILWEIRISAAAFLVSFLTAVIFSGIMFKIISALWITAYLVMFAWYYPLKYKKLSYNIDENILVVNCGVVYRRRKSIFLKNIQYISTVRTPLQRIAKLETVIVHAAGGFIFIPNLKIEESRLLMYTLEEKGKQGGS